MIEENQIWLTVDGSIIKIIQLWGGSDGKCDVYPNAYCSFKQKKYSMQFTRSFLKERIIKETHPEEYL